MNLTLNRTSLKQLNGKSQTQVAEFANNFTSQTAFFLIRMTRSVLPEVCPAARNSYMASDTVARAKPEFSEFHIQFMLIVTSEIWF